MPTTTSNASRVRPCSMSARLIGSGSLRAINGPRATQLRGQKGAVVLPFEQLGHVSVNLEGLLAIEIGRQAGPDLASEAAEACEQTAHRRLEVALDECSVGSDGLQRARHDLLWLPPPH